MANIGDFLEKYISELSTEKLNFIKKYDLKLYKNMCWYSNKNNSIARTYFKHSFLVNNGMLEILFRKYQLCFAKIKFFRLNLESYSFYRYDPFQNFIQTELWDAEFFKHNKSGRYIDLRFLSQITELHIFEQLIQSLEDEST